ncbi:MAG: DUF3568 family protein [Phycisphaerae bacterium]|nr:DUF3568 family protein [Phycisphaerae bacterium]NIP53033.1 DUF3568 family protein [Phycisphaerae bacterium]NIS53692.1 DUF3568 family protein [Phycisphaerae bacterium]NIU11255.1 DUF3568 family protein [Phycisphaerae bacterium]NIU57312.1 DUF3568 family protein [Phycisphaerae bacterium]
MSINKILKLFVVAVLMLALCGCGRPTIIGTDAAVYSRGNLYAVSGHDLNAVYKAALASLKQLEIEVAEKNKDVFYAKVVGNIADGRTVTIRIKPGENKATELRINTGKFGDEERSRVIYAKIQQNLKGISG